MKKIFTMMIAAMMINSAFAQYGQKEDRNVREREDIAKADGRPGYDRYDRHDDRGNTYYFTEREKDMQINQINRAYDYKIRSVQNRFFMSWYEKKRQVKLLEQQKDCEIKAVMDKFYDKRNMFTNPRRRGYDKW